jgi:mono/diheme cytochrome c family protein
MNPASMRSPTIASIVVLGALLCAPALAHSPAALDSPGHAQAVRSCAACHAIAAATDSPNPGAPAFIDIGRRYPDARTLYSRITAVTRHGHYAMPPRSVSRGARRALSTYISEITEQAGRQ